jgi:hypothetical protein
VVLGVLTRVLTPLPLRTRRRGSALGRTGDLRLDAGRAARRIEDLTA